VRQTEGPRSHLRRRTHDDVAARMVLHVQAAHHSVADDDVVVGGAAVHELGGRVGCVGKRAE
jgi:hypothetical protein